MSWFKRELKGIITSTEEKKEAPDGIWNKCPQCKKPLHYSEQVENQYVCHYCGFHIRIGSKEYFSILFDNNEFTELHPNLTSGDPLHFEDTKKYADRLKETAKKTGLNDAIRAAHGKMEGQEVVIACMDFNFIGGSMGSVVGEKIARSIDYCIAHKVPFLMISKSGGARMMEAAFSLMQMAKTSAKLALLGQAKIPYISLLTDPTTGGAPMVTCPFVTCSLPGRADSRMVTGRIVVRVYLSTFCTCGPRIYCGLPLPGLILLITVILFTMVVVVL